MAQPFEIFDGLADQVPEIPAGSIVSRAIFTNEQVAVSLPGIAPGQELSEQVPGQPAILEVWRGKGFVHLYGETYVVGPGSWIYIGDETAHTIQSTTEMVAPLTLLTR